jgi:hypothetical protein
MRALYYASITAQGMTILNRWQEMLVHASRETELQVDAAYHREVAILEMW